MDRLDLIAATGADALAMECSMKGYTNDMATAVQQIGQRLTLFANIDPVNVIQNGSDAALEAEIRRQAAAGGRARGFVIAAASPITPATPVERMRQFIELGAQIAVSAPAARQGGARETNDGRTQ